MTRVGDLVEPFVPCAQCADTPGWVSVVNERFWNEPESFSLKRCRCWIIHQRKVLEALQAKGKKTRNQSRVDDSQYGAQPDTARDRQE